jgi:predicted small secreted protein
MKKQLTIMGIVILLVSIELSGCNSTEQTTGKTPEELIIGNWDAEIEDIEINFIFYENHSVCGSVAGMSVWSEYNLTKDELIFTNSDGTIIYNEYSFSDNNKKLIINDPNGEVMVLTRH